MKNNLILLLGAISLLASCAREYQLDLPELRPQIVMNCVAEADEPLKAQVERTILVTEDTIRGIHLDNATLTLTVNGQVQPPMRLLTESNRQTYVSNYRPVAHDRIRLEVASPLGRAWAEDVMPQIVEIEDVKHEVLQNSSKQGTTRLYHITFTDPPGERNFYFFCVTTHDNHSVYVNYDKDDVFRPSVSGLNAIGNDTELVSQGRAFDDSRIDGKTYTLRITEPAWNSNTTRVFKLYSVSQAYHRYLTRLYHDETFFFSDEMARIGLAEPVAYPNNINGGVGILGLFQVSEFEYEVK